ncbi:hypothetical protein DFH11DRAFT_1883463 [Phellopilus nigrolimitatus]|nr:hypothetical protein DFH11DRAFT_1883463 [Phellopilus nigrolimitatus]
MARVLGRARHDICSAGSRGQGGDVRGLFHQLAGAEGRRDRGALLALLEPEKRVRENEFGSDLTAPSLALQHYRAMRVKQVQNDTLSHFVLSCTATFSLAADCDLILTQERVESSQIYATNSPGVRPRLSSERSRQREYSQVTNLNAFEDRLDNSLQRDLVKLHGCMSLVHEGPSTELADTELRV